MKLKIFLPLLVFLLSAGIRAQDPILFYEDSVKIGKGSLPGMGVLIPEVEYQKTFDNWIKTLESGTKSKVVTENGELSIFGANIKEIAPDPVNVYSRLSASDTGLYIGAAFELRKDLYIEKATGEAELARARTFLFNFAKDQYISLVEEQLKAEETKLKDLEKELGSLEREGSGMERTISKSEKTISSEAEKLTDLNNHLTSLTAAISEHSMELPSMNSGEERDTKEDYLKGLEKDKKKTLKSITKSEKKKRKAERALAKARSGIPKIDRNQDDVRKTIDDQAAVVQKYSGKLNQVKNFILN
ncbi:MAG: hypothetical protein JXR66_04595 [Bacteroidales bacterium]|nr:hypothetical protein [Bacteroidales bacterium]MBN2632814.1 hypothetical protein [Bacteroidales bacterium]